MELPKGAFVGIKSAHRAVGDEDDEEYSETTLALESFENDDINLAGIATAGGFPFKLLKNKNPKWGTLVFRLA